MSVTITDVLTEYGAFYRAGGQNVQDLIGMIYQGSETDQHFMPVPTDKTKVEKSSSEITSVLQAFQKKFTPKGNTTFKPKGWLLNKLKIDVEEYPDDIEDSWLGFLASNNLSRKDWPFVRYWLQELVLKKSIEDYELNEVYYGKYIEPTVDVPNPDGMNFDGIRYKLNKGISDSNITTIPSGAWSTDPKTFVGEIEDWTKEIPELYRMRIKKLYMSQDLRTRFRQGMREKYNMNYAQTSDLETVMDTMIQVIGLPSMVGDQKIFCSVPMNMQIYIKKPQNPRVFKVEELKRLVNAHTDFWKGFGFWIAEWVFTNDLNLGAPVIDSPASGDTAAIGTAGGDNIVITGRDFLHIDDSDNSNVTVGGTNVTSFTVDSDTQITAVAPAKSAGTYDLVVTNEFGSTTSASAVVAS